MTRFGFRLDRETRELLVTLPELLADAGDIGGRLDYRAHPEDAPAEERYRELVGNSLDDLRTADRDILIRVSRSRRSALKRPSRG